jgi:hypothetical protein
MPIIRTVIPPAHVFECGEGSSTARTFASASDDDAKVPGAARIVTAFLVPSQELNNSGGATSGQGSGATPTQQQPSPAPTTPSSSMTLIVVDSCNTTSGSRCIDVPLPLIELPTSPASPASGSGRGATSTAAMRPWNVKAGQQIQTPFAREGDQQSAPEFTIQSEVDLCIEHPICFLSVLSKQVRSSATPPAGAGQRDQPSSSRYLPQNSMLSLYYYHRLTQPESGLGGDDAVLLPVKLPASLTSAGRSDGTSTSSSPAGRSGGDANQRQGLNIRELQDWRFLSVTSSRNADGASASSSASAGQKLIPYSNIFLIRAVALTRTGIALWQLGVSWVKGKRERGPSGLRSGTSSMMSSTSTASPLTGLSSGAMGNGGEGSPSGGLSSQELNASETVLAVVECRWAWGTDGCFKSIYACPGLKASIAAANDNRLVVWPSVDRKKGSAQEAGSDGSSSDDGESELQNNSTGLFNADQEGESSPPYPVLSRFASILENDVYRSIGTSLTFSKSIRWIQWRRLPWCDLFLLQLFDSEPIHCYTVSSNRSAQASAEIPPSYPSTSSSSPPTISESRQPSTSGRFGVHELTSFVPTLLLRHRPVDGNYEGIENEKEEETVSCLSMIDPSLAGSPSAAFPSVVSWTGAGGQGGAGTPTVTSGCIGPRGLSVISVGNKGSVSVLGFRLSPQAMPQKEKSYRVEGLLKESVALHGSVRKVYARPCYPLPPSGAVTNVCDGWGLSASLDTNAFASVTELPRMTPGGSSAANNSSSGGNAQLSLRFLDLVLHYADGFVERRYVDLSTLTPSAGGGKPRFASSLIMGSTGSGSIAAGTSRQDSSTLAKEKRTIAIQALTTPIKPISTPNTSTTLLSGCISYLPSPSPRSAPFVTAHLSLSSTPSNEAVYNLSILAWGGPTLLLAATHHQLSAEQLAIEPRDIMQLKEDLKIEFITRRRFGVFSRCVRTSSGSAGVDWRGVGVWNWDDSLSQEVATWFRSYQQPMFPDWTVSISAAEGEEDRESLLSPPSVPALNKLEPITKGISVAAEHLGTQGFDQKEFKATPSVLSSSIGKQCTPFSPGTEDGSLSFTVTDSGLQVVRTWVGSAPHPSSMQPTPSSSRTTLQLDCANLDASGSAWTVLAARYVCLEGTLQGPILALVLLRNSQHSSKVVLLGWMLSPVSVVGLEANGVLCVREEWPIPEGAANQEFGADFEVQFFLHSHTQLFAAIRPIIPRGNAEEANQPPSLQIFRFAVDQIAAALSRPLTTPTPSASSSSVSKAQNVELRGVILYWSLTAVALGSPVNRCLVVVACTRTALVAIPLNRQIEAGATQTSLSSMLTLFRSQSPLGLLFCSNMPDNSGLLVSDGGYLSVVMDTEKLVAGSLLPSNLKNFGLDSVPDFNSWDAIPPLPAVTAGGTAEANSALSSGAEQSESAGVVSTARVLFHPQRLSRLFLEGEIPALKATLLYLKRIIELRTGNAAPAPHQEPDEIDTTEADEKPPADDPTLPTEGGPSSSEISLLSVLARPRVPNTTAPPREQPLLEGSDPVPIWAPPAADELQQMLSTTRAGILSAAAATAKAGASSLSTVTAVSLEILQGSLLEDLEGDVSNLSAPLGNLTSAEHLQLVGVVKALRQVRDQTDRGDVATARFLFLQQLSQLGKALRMTSLARLPSSAFAWAALSDTQGPLLAWTLPTFSGNTMAVTAAARQKTGRFGAGGVSQADAMSSWSGFHSTGVAFWLSNLNLLKQAVEQLGKEIFTVTKDPRAAALAFVLVGKASTTLANMCQSVNDGKLQAFFCRDFKIEKNREAAVANAYVALSKGLVEYAAAFFVLAGDLAAASEVIVRRFKCLPLALLVVRLASNDDKFALTRLRDMVIGVSNGGGGGAPTEGAECSDPWLDFVLSWRCGERADALKVLASRGAVFNGGASLDDTAAKSSSTVTAAAGATNVDSQLWLVLPFIGLAIQSTASLSKQREAVLSTTLELQLLLQRFLSLLRDGDSLDALALSTQLLVDIGKLKKESNEEVDKSEKLVLELTKRAAELRAAPSRLTANAAASKPAPKPAPKIVADFSSGTVMFGFGDDSDEDEEPAPPAAPPAATAVDEEAPANASDAGSAAVAEVERESREAQAAKAEAQVLLCRLGVVEGLVRAAAQSIQQAIGQRYLLLTDWYNRKTGPFLWSRRNDTSATVSPGKENVSSSAVSPHAALVARVLQPDPPTFNLASYNEAMAVVCQLTSESLCMFRSSMEGIPRSALISDETKLQHPRRILIRKFIAALERLRYHAFLLNLERENLLKQPAPNQAGGPTSTSSVMAIGGKGTYLYTLDLYGRAVAHTALTALACLNRDCSLALSLCQISFPLPSVRLQDGNGEDLAASAFRYFEYVLRHRREIEEQVLQAWQDDSERAAHELDSGITANPERTNSSDLEHHPVLLILLGFVANSTSRSLRQRITERILPTHNRSIDLALLAVQLHDISSAAVSCGMPPLLFNHRANSASYHPASYVNCFPCRTLSDDLYLIVQHLQQNRGRLLALSDRPLGMSRGTSPSLVSAVQSAAARAELDDTVTRALQRLLKIQCGTLFAAAFDIPTSPTRPAANAANGLDTPTSATAPSTFEVATAGTGNGDSTMVDILRQCFELVKDHVAIAGLMIHYGGNTVAWPTTAFGEKVSSPWTSVDGNQGDSKDVFLAPAGTEQSGAIGASLISLRRQQSIKLCTEELQWGAMVRETKRLANANSTAMNSDSSALRDGRAAQLILARRVRRLRRRLGASPNQRLPLVTVGPGGQSRTTSAVQGFCVDHSSFDNVAYTLYSGAAQSAGTGSGSSGPRAAGPGPMGGASGSPNYAKGQGQAAAQTPGSPRSITGVGIAHGMRDHLLRDEMREVYESTHLERDVAATSFVCGAPPLGGISSIGSLDASLKPNWVKAHPHLPVFMAGGGGYKHPMLLHFGTGEVAVTFETIPPVVPWAGGAAGASPTAQAPSLPPAPTGIQHPQSNVTHVDAAFSIQGFSFAALDTMGVLTVWRFGAHAEVEHPILQMKLFQEARSLCYLGGHSTLICTLGEENVGTGVRGGGAICVTSLKIVDVLSGQVIQEQNTMTNSNGGGLGYSQSSFGATTTPTPFGKPLASGFTVPPVKIMNLACCSLASDLLLLANPKGEVRLYDVGSKRLVGTAAVNIYTLGSTLRKSQLQQPPVTKAAQSPGAQSPAAEMDAGNLGGWGSPTTNYSSSSSSSSKKTSSNPNLTALETSSFDPFTAAAFADGTVYIWDTQRLLHLLWEHSDPMDFMFLGGETEPEYLKRVEEALLGVWELHSNRVPVQSTSTSSSSSNLNTANHQAGSGNPGGNGHLAVLGGLTSGIPTSVSGLFFTPSSLLACGAEGVSGLQL